LKRGLDAMRFWKAIADHVPPGDSLAGGSAKQFYHGAYMGDGFGRGTQKGDQTFPWVLPDYS
jgi:hypothetical protein